MKDYGNSFFGHYPIYHHYLYGFISISPHCLEFSHLPYLICRFIVHSSKIFIITAPECVESADCPNEGINYKCIANLCQCTNGFELNGDACEVQGNMYLDTKSCKNTVP